MIRSRAALICLLAYGVAWSASAQTEPPPQSLPDSSQASPEWLAKNQGLGGAATAPLDDLNLRRVEIPAILLSAAQKPYDLTNLDACAALVDEIMRLDSVLGLDLDAPAVADSRTLTEKSEAMAGKQAVSTVRGAATSFIPYRGLVRTVTGAEKHQREVDLAISAGQSRRAFLKGIGMARNCAPPAAPAGFIPKKTASAKSKAH